LLSSSSSSHHRQLHSFPTRRSSDLATANKQKMKTYDVTVPIRSGMPLYEGDPGVEIKAWSALAKGDSANVSFLHFGAHTGTHVRSEQHTSELQSLAYLVCRLLLEKK